MTDEGTQAHIDALAARVQALTAERDELRLYRDEAIRLMESANADVKELRWELDVAWRSHAAWKHDAEALRAELAAANALCAEWETTATAANRTIEALQETLDRVTALADEPHEELRAAVAEVYRRHDSNAPLNQVNNVEWVEAVESVLRAALTPEGKP